MLSSSAAPHFLTAIINSSAAADCSDIHIAADIPPHIRCNGLLRPLPEAAPLSASETEEICLYLAGSQWDDYLHNKELDTSLEWNNDLRFRCSLFRQQGKHSAVLRVIKSEVPAWKQLNIPDILKKICCSQQGLILVTGPAGSGKSTTLAAFLEYINDNHHRHIITLEDPIEFVHKPNLSVFSQREIGRDTNSFPNALRSALRADPDVILVGELRDPETMRIAITAAETGHLIMATMHTTSAPGSVSRLLDSFPAQQQPQIRRQLADTLLAVVYQKLYPLRSQNGRIAAHEILLTTPAVKSLIREGKLHQLTTAMQTSRREGMQTMIDCCRNLYKAGLIDMPKDMQ